MSKQWTCPVVMGARGPNDFILCGFKCAIEHSGADHERINHLTIHNPSPAEWTEAHSRIQAWKERAKDHAKKATA
jgi:hypothetical protein